MSFLKKYYDAVDKHRPLTTAGGLTLMDVVRPLYNSAYKDGEFEGKKQGYEMASSEYEEKLLRQADRFLEEKKVLKNELESFLELLDEYDSTINELNKKIDRTETENEYLHQLLMRERELRKMKK